MHAPRPCRETHSPAPSVPANPPLIPAVTPSASSTSIFRTHHILSANQFLVPTPDARITDDTLRRFGSHAHDVVSMWAPSDFCNPEDPMVQSAYRKCTYDQLVLAYQRLSADLAQFDRLLNIYDRLIKITSSTAAS